MNVIQTPLAGLLIIEPTRQQDSRGYFYEFYQSERYARYGLPHFVQDNLSRSKKDVIRGLHYQLPYSQGKLVSVLRGEVWDVCIDLRKSSATFGQFFSTTLNDNNNRQIYVPTGFAHGFCVLSEEADFYYKCSDTYQPAAEQGVLWSDETLNIPWPTKNPIVSNKDQELPSLNKIPHEKLFA